MAMSSLHAENLETDERGGGGGGGRRDRASRLILGSLSAHALETRTAAGIEYFAC